jgi:hypothetical protein
MKRLSRKTFNWQLSFASITFIDSLLTNFTPKTMKFDPRLWLCALSGAAGTGMMEVLPHEEIENCNERGQASKVLDLSNIAVIIEGDNDFFINGTVKFVVPISSPWEIYAYGEKFYRDSWVHGAEKKMQDFCADMHDKSSPAYKFLKDQKKCPFKAGVSKVFAMPLKFQKFKLQLGPMDLRNVQDSDRLSGLHSAELLGSLALDRNFDS